MLSTSDPGCLNHYQVDSVVCFNTLLDSDLFSGYHYPLFEQPGPGWRFHTECGAN